MRTEQLQYFLEISKCKSMNLASEKLHISPQALSIAMKTLESELNMKLLDRTTTGVSLTENGEKLKNIAKQFFHNLSELQTDNPSEKPDLNNFQLTVPYGFCETYLSNIMESLYIDFPSIEVNIKPLDYYEIIQSVLCGQNQFAITYKLFFNGEDFSNYIPPEVEFTPLVESKFYAMVPKNFPISNYKTISLKTLFEYPFIAYAPAKHLFESVHHYYTDIVPKIFNAPTVSIELSMLKQGRGSSLGMYSSSNDHSPIEYPLNVQKIALREKLRAVLGYVTMRNTILDRSSLSQIKFLKQFFEQ